MGSGEASAGAEIASAALSLATFCKSCLLLWYLRLLFFEQTACRCLPITTRRSQQRVPYHAISMGKLVAIIHRCSFRWLADGAPACRLARTRGHRSVFAHISCTDLYANELVVPAFASWLPRGLLINLARPRHRKLRLRARFSIIRCKPPQTHAY